MSVDLKVPPLVGTYGPAGAGKTADKLRAAPDSLVFAGPGQLVPAVSFLGIEPRAVEILDAKTTDFDDLKRRVEKRMKSDRGIKKVIIDDFSMVAARTERLFQPRFRDGRQLYGQIKLKAGEMFDEWRALGLCVFVDCHEDPPEWKPPGDDGKPVSRIAMNRLDTGRPLLPGKKAGPDFVKASDMFYRVMFDDSVPGGLPVVGAVRPWPWRYVAGPYGFNEHYETKDRWNVATAATDGILPLNLGEILRWVHRTNGVTTWAIVRPAGKEWMDQFVDWGSQAIASGMTVDQAVSEVAKALIGRKATVAEIRWVVDDVRARYVIEQAHSMTAQLATLGISLSGSSPGPGGVPPL